MGLVNRLLGFVDWTLGKLPPPPRLEGYARCPSCLQEIVARKSLVCTRCGHTLRVPLGGWVGALLLVLSLPILALWVMGIHLPNLWFFGGLIAVFWPADLFLWVGLVFLLIGSLAAYSAASAIRTQSLIVAVD
jgi:hypothetical protein